MGREQIRTGKHLLFYFTGLILLFLTGCALFEKVQDSTSPAEKEKIRQKEALAAEEKRKEEAATAHLLKGRELLAQGYWEGAFSENQMIVTTFRGKSLAAEALFMMGLIQLHPDNPNRDIGKGLESMKKVVKDYPNSYFGQYAKAWIGILMMNEKTIKENEKISKENEKLTKDLEKLLREYEKMSNMLEEYKKVDIEIEGKKREKGR